MDLDDDELWAIQYSRNYIKKNKIVKKREELKAKMDDKNSWKLHSWEWDAIPYAIDVLNELLEE